MEQSSTLALSKVLEILKGKGYLLTYPECKHGFRQAKKQENCASCRKGELPEETSFPIRIKDGENKDKMAYRLCGKWSGKWTFANHAVDDSGCQHELSSLPQLKLPQQEQEEASKAAPASVPTGRTVVGLWFIVGTDDEVCDDVEGHEAVGQRSSFAVDGFELMKIHGWDPEILKPLEVLHYLFDNEWCDHKNERKDVHSAADTFLLSTLDAEHLIKMRTKGLDPSTVFSFSRGQRPWISNPVDLITDSALQEPSNSVLVTYGDGVVELLVQTLYANQEPSNETDDTPMHQMSSNSGSATDERNCCLVQTSSNDDNFARIWCLEILVDSDWKAWLKDAFDGFEYDSYYGKLASLAKLLGLETTPAHGEKESAISKFLQRVEVQEDDDDAIDGLLRLVSKIGRLHGLHADQICVHNHKVKATVFPVNKDGENADSFEREFTLKEFLQQPFDHPKHCTLTEDNVKERLKEVLEETMTVIKINRILVENGPYESIKCDVEVDDLTFNDLNQKDKPVLIPDRGLRLFPSQKKMATEIVNRLLLILKHEYHLELGGPNELKNYYGGVKYYVMTTQHKSLFEQTQGEVRQYLEDTLEDVNERMLKHAGGDFEGCSEKLRKLQKSVQQGIEDWKDFHEKTRKGESRKPDLHVIIDDECHTSLKSTNYHGKYLNEVKYNDAPVFVVLSVSATPYAVLSRNSRVPPVFLRKFVHNETYEAIVVDPRKFRPPPGSKTLEECTITVGDHDVSLVELGNTHFERNVIHWRAEGEEEEDKTTSDGDSPQKYMSLDKYLSLGKIKGSEDGFSLFYDYWSDIFFQDRKRRPEGAEEQVDKDANLLLAVEYTYSTCLLATLEKMRVNPERSADFFIECLEETMGNFPNCSKKPQDVTNSKLALCMRVLIGICFDVGGSETPDWRQFMWDQFMTSPYDRDMKAANKRALKERFKVDNADQVVFGGMTMLMNRNKSGLIKLLDALIPTFKKKREITQKIHEIDNDAAKRSENSSSKSTMLRLLEEQANCEFPFQTMNVVYSLGFEQYKARVESGKRPPIVGKLALVRMTDTKGAELFLKMVRETMRIIYQRLRHEHGIETLMPWKIWQDTGKSSIRQFVSATYKILPDDSDYYHNVSYREMTCPCILLLVEKGRMGDRFFHDTGNSKLPYRLTGVDCSRGLGLAALDLRIRHTRNVGTAATIIQEFGRVCRYSNEDNTCLLPSILVSSHFYKTAHVDQAKRSSNILELKFDSPDQTLKFLHSRDYLKKKASSYPRFLCEPRPNMLLNDDDDRSVEPHKLRLVLKAEPQMGKTGVYLHFVRLLRDYITVDSPVFDADADADFDADFDLPTPPSLSDIFGSDIPKMSYIDKPYWRDLINSRKDVISSWSDGTKAGKYHSHKMVERLMALRSTFEKGQIDGEVVTSLTSLFGGMNEVDLANDIKNLLASWGDYPLLHSSESSDYAIFDVRTEENLKLAKQFVNLDGMFREGIEEAIEPLCGFVIANCIYLPLSARSDFWSGSHRSKLQPQKANYPHHCATVPSQSSTTVHTQLTPIDVDPPRSSGYMRFSVVVSCAPNVNGFFGRRWIFHPSVRAESAKLCLPGITKQDEPYFHQAIVVQPKHFDDYRKLYPTFTIVCLPDSLLRHEGGAITVEEGGIGFSRLVIQLLAYHEKLDVVVMSDDRVRAMGMLTPDRGWEYTNFSRPLEYLYNVMSKNPNRDVLLDIDLTNRLGSELVVDDVERHKELLEDFDRNWISLDDPDLDRDFFYHFSDPEDYIAVVGCTRNPWGRQLDDMKTGDFPAFVTSLSIYSTFVLNVTLTVKKGVFYRPTKVWEDIYFLRDCHRANLFTVKSRYVWLVRDTNRINMQATAPSREELADHFAKIRKCRKEFFWNSTLFRTYPEPTLNSIWMGARSNDECMHKIIQTMQTEGEETVLHLSKLLGCVQPESRVLEKTQFLRLGNVRKPRNQSPALTEVTG